MPASQPPFMEKPEQVPEEVWDVLPAFPFEYSGICAILPLPRIILDKLCPALAPQFKLSNLIIAPSEVQVGSPVAIYCLVENTGSEAGTKKIGCKVDGVTMAEETVALEAGESVAVSFQVTPTVAKTYSVSVNGLYGSFNATTEVPPGVADIRVENLTITPTEVMIGETVQISVTATNYGTASGTKRISCEVV